jgi:hypothetical protein
MAAKKKKVWVELDYEHGDIVYLTTDPYQYPREIQRIKIMPGGKLKYKIFVGEDGTWHYANELNDVPNPEMKREDPED